VIWGSDNYRSGFWLLVGQIFCLIHSSEFSGSSDDVSPVVCSCEIHVFIRFLHTRIMSALEIHRELCMVYDQNIMNEGNVRQWCTVFKDERADVHNEE
jgi:hypothetical protein